MDPMPSEKAAPRSRPAFAAASAGKEDREEEGEPRMNADERR
jgi:hypothetical protein